MGSCQSTKSLNKQVQEAKSKPKRKSINIQQLRTITIIPRKQSQRVIEPAINQNSKAKKSSKENLTGEPFPSRKVNPKNGQSSMRSSTVGPVSTITTKRGKKQILPLQSDQGRFDNKSYRIRRKSGSKEHDIFGKKLSKIEQNYDGINFVKSSKEANFGKKRFLINKNKFQLRVEKSQNESNFENRNLSFVSKKTDSIVFLRRSALKKSSQLRGTNGSSMSNRQNLKQNLFIKRKFHKEPSKILKNLEPMYEISSEEEQRKPDSGREDPKQSLYNAIGPVIRGNRLDKTQLSFLEQSLKVSKIDPNWGNTTLTRAHTKKNTKTTTRMPTITGANTTFFSGLNNTIFNKIDLDRNPTIREHTGNVTIGFDSSEHFDRVQSGNGNFFTDSRNQDLLNQLNDHEKLKDYRRRKGKIKTDLGSSLKSNSYQVIKEISKTSGIEEDTLSSRIAKIAELAKSKQEELSQQERVELANSQEIEDLSNENLPSGADANEFIINKRKSTFNNPADHTILDLIGRTNEYIPTKNLKKNFLDFEESAQSELMSSSFCSSSSSGLFPEIPTPGSTSKIIFD